MKILAFFILIGLASASVQRLDDATEHFVIRFVEGVQSAPTLDEYPALYAEDDIHTKLGQKLKDGMDRVLEKIKEAVDTGREVRKELIDEFKTLRQKLRDINVDIGKRGKEIIQDLKERFRDYLKQILEKYGLNKRDSEMTFQDMLRKVREHIKNTVDPELLKEKITKIFDQGSQILQLFLRTLKEKGRRKLEILIDTLLNDDEDEDRESRSIKEYWEKIKDYFKDLKIDLQEKYMKFGEWMKEFLDKGMEKSKDKFDNIRAIAKEFLRHAKNASKEVGSEALDFFQQYKKELGNIWEEIKDTVNEMRNRKD